MKIFTFLFRRARRELLLTTVVMTLAGLGVSGLIFLVNASVTQGNMRAELFAAFLGLALLIIVSRTAGSYLLARVMARSLFDLRMHLARRLMEVPFKQFEAIGGDRALAAITSDISAVNAVLGGLPYFLRNAVVAICCFGYMLFVSWHCFLVMLLFIVLGLTWYRLIAARAARHQKVARQEWDVLFGHFRALVGGIKELKLSTRKRGDFLGEMIEPCEKRYQREQLFSATFFTAASSVSQTLAFVMIGLVLFVLPAALDIPRDVQITYTLLLVFIMTPFEGIVAWIPSLVSADVAMGRVEALGVTLEKEAENLHRETISPTWSSIRLEGVSHTYYRERENEHFTLGPIDLEVVRGQITVIAGGNGSGKTTLAKVIAGLYAPEGGKIFLDHVEVSEALQESYRQNFSVVFSDFYLFERLIGIEDFDQAIADRYLRSLQLDHKVSIENLSYSTTKLSQGQRKRLALLSAYLEDRQVYVFDEWAADQDPQFKDVFYRELLPQLKARGKVIIVISHDDRYFDIADQFIRLEYGHIDASAREPAEMTV